MNMQHKLFVNKEWFEFDMRSLLADFIRDEIAMKVYSREMIVCTVNQKSTQ